MRAPQIPQKISLNLCVPELRIADIGFNALKIQELIQEVLAEESAFPILLFPQLSLSAASCGDLFGLPLLAKSCLDALSVIEAALIGRDCFLAVGLPLQLETGLYDALALLDGSGILAFVLNQTPELRHFQTWGTLEQKDLEWNGKRVPILPTGRLPGRVSGWQVSVQIGALDPEIQLAEDEILLNPCALPAFADVACNETFQAFTQSHHGLLAVCSAGASESTGKKVYSGLAQVWQGGTLLAQGTELSFSNQLTRCELDPSNEYAFDEVRAALPERQSAVPWLFERNRDALLERIFETQAAGLVGRLRHTGLKRMVVGLSGGADSSMALLVCCRAAERLGMPAGSILGVSMPGPGSSHASVQRSSDLLHLSGVEARIHRIDQAVRAHLQEIGHGGKPDLTFENAQARIRTLYLMNYANLHQGLVVGTGDLSEIALGWSTYNGDQMSMYNVNAGLPKTVLLELLPRAAKCLFGEEGLALAQAVVAAPISPELQPINAQGQTEQITEEALGPYRLHDFFLWHLVGEKQNPAQVFELARAAFAGEFEAEFILQCLRRFIGRFFRHQFKRNASPDGPQLFSMGLDACLAWRVPADASANLWLQELDALEVSLGQEKR